MDSSLPPSYEKAMELNDPLPSYEEISKEEISREKNSREVPSRSIETKIEFPDENQEIQIQRWDTYVIIFKICVAFVLGVTPICILIFHMCRLMYK